MGEVFIGLFALIFALPIPIIVLAAGADLISSIRDSLG